MNQKTVNPTQKPTECAWCIFTELRFLEKHQVWVCNLCDKVQPKNPLPRQIHPRCKGVALKLAIFFQHFDDAVPAHRLIEQANIPRPSIEGALIQGLLERDGNDYRLTTYAQSVLYR